MANEVQSGVAAPPSAQSGGAKCRFCLNTTFRRARFRGGDIFSILILRYPVRCSRCGQLQKMGLWTAIKADKPTPKEGKTVGLMATLPVEYAAKLQEVAAVDSRAAIPLQTLLDPLDIRCQYCPGQAFRRSKLRALDFLVLARMRYPARCLRCGQRQLVSFIVAATGVPSHYKQARTMRNKDTWKDWTQNTAAVEGTTGAKQGWLPPVPVEMELPVGSARRGSGVVAVPGTRVAEAVEAPVAKLEKKPVDDQAIW